jgi:exopolysaccharide biosynthesis polyprenyl glycosylphosphotransferase
MLAAADLVVAASVAALVAHSPSDLGLGLLLLPAWVVTAKLLGLYDRDQRSIRHLTIDELPSLAAWAAVGIALLGLLPYVSSDTPFSFGLAIVAWLAATLAALVLRGSARWFWRRTTPPELTAVLGDGDLGRAARRKLKLFPDMHLRLVPERALGPVGANGDRLASLEGVIEGLDRVIVATERPDPELIAGLAALCRRDQVKLSVVSPVRGPAMAAPTLSEVADLPLLEYDTRDVSRSTVLIKRVFDVVVASVSTLVLAPFVPLAVLAIRLDSRGPAIFSQRRAGREGRVFTMYKLRTMSAGAEQSLADVVELDALPEPVFKLRADPRVTRVGRFLRRFSLDELPQLVNVLRGEMSIVGPRPEQIELVERYLPEHRLRLMVTPGMTGPMQVFGRGELDLSERLAVELDYVENLSLARDVGILLRTLPAVFRGTGAF